MSADFVTIGTLVQITRKPAHVINYALSRYGPEPAGRIGIIRVWSRDDVPKIIESLRRTTERSTSTQCEEGVLA